MYSRLLLAVGAVSVAAVLGCREDSEVPLAPASTTAPTQARSTAGNTQAPLVVARRGPVTDRYIVVLKSGIQDVPGEAHRQLAAAHGRLHLTYTHALKGYSATLTPAELSVVRREAAVSYIEPDQWVSADDTEQPTPSWGLDRIDQRDLPLTDSYTYTPTGTGVRVYIIDTGIRRTHHDFGGRAISGQDFVGDGNGTYDCAGHGTHVAGTVAGSTYGVAKAATLVAGQGLEFVGHWGNRLGDGAPAGAGCRQHEPGWWVFAGAQ
jgi:subtilisin family serine protease